MSESRWQGDGPDFTIECAGHRWTLRVQSADPGLVCQEGPSVGHFLTLHGLTTADHRGERDWPFGEASSLLGCERVRHRVQATYVLQDWPELYIRASWAPTPDDHGFDLEIQVSNLSRGVQRGLEMTVGSFWIERAHSWLPSSTTETPFAPVLQPLSARSYPPHLCPDPLGLPGRYYAEMVRPGDCVRRQLDAPVGSPSAPRGTSIRHVFFGCDLEKGVVLRGRIRGRWIDSPIGPPDDELRRSYESFLSEPPPLGP